MALISGGGGGGSQTAHLAFRQFVDTNRLLLQVYADAGFSSPSLVWSLSPDGSDHYTLPLPTAVNYEVPVMFPTGTRLAAIIKRSGDTHLRACTVDLDGENLALISDDLQDAVTVFWSRDGSRLAWGEAGSTLWLADADGSNPHQIYNDLLVGYLMPWSSDDTQLAITRNSNAHVALVAADGSGLISDLGFTGYVYDWSPDGSTILYGADAGGGDYELFTCAANGSNPAQLTHLSLLGFGPYDAAYSPDGTQIAVVFYDLPSFARYTLATMDADGSNGSFSGDLTPWAPQINTVAWGMRG